MRKNCKMVYCPITKLRNISHSQQGMNESYIKKNILIFECDIIIFLRITCNCIFIIKIWLLNMF